jgi:hypothetical protein
VKYTPALRHHIKHVSPADLATVPGLPEVDARWRDFTS